MRHRARLASGLAVAALLVAAAAAAAADVAGRVAPASEGAVAGRVTVAAPGLTLAEVGPVVVWAEPASGGPSSAGREPAPAAIEQHNAQFEPAFLAVTTHQLVQMPNRDTIFHNVFSFSEENAFDLGLYPGGASRSVRFAHPGVVRVYCSIHESMTATIFVSPSPWFAAADAEGRFALEDVPPGDWILNAWSEKLPVARRRYDATDAREGVSIALGAAEGS